MVMAGEGAKPMVSNHCWNNFVMTESCSCNNNYYKISRIVTVRWQTSDCLQLQQWAESKRGPGSLPPTVKLRMPKPLVPSTVTQAATDEVLFSSVMFMRWRDGKLTA